MHHPNNHVKAVEHCGVNLGGWFIAEKWMTPLLFKKTNAVDTLGLLAEASSRKRYLEHVRTFISKQDLTLLIRQQVSLLRVPVAWWMISDEYSEVKERCQERLDWLFRYAEKNGMHILLDFHGARGSQNGKDHSGGAGQIDWKQYYTQNINCLTKLADRYNRSSALWGIELINEPVIKGHYWFLRRYYRQAEKQLRDILPLTVNIVIHDGFNPLLFSHIGLWRSRILLDLHLYEITVKKNESLESYFKRRDKQYRRKIRLLRHFQPVIVGEWSGVVPKCFLEGQPKEVRDRIVHENITRQLRLYDTADAWMFWSYKTDDQLMWNFERLLRSNDKLLY